MIRNILAAACTTLFVSTGFAADDLAKQIEAAHGADAWYGHELVKADMMVEFGGTVRMDGIATFDPYLSVSRIDNKDGTSVVFDGKEAYVSPASAEMKSARFAVLTWPYFLAAPMKIADPGVNLEIMDALVLDGHEKACARMTFDAGVGDAPDDWYVLYTDPDSHQLEAMAYIVTFFSGSDSSKAEPHAIKYEDFKDFGGATLATKWTFYNWNKEEGLVGEPIGSAVIRDVTYTEMDESLFEKPADSRMDKHPQK